MKKIRAFTLAEVLITLGVIGVVAALTLPSVIQHHQKQTTLSKVKKFSSIINQAIRLSEVENDNCANWTGANISNLDFYNTYLKNYMNVLETSIETVPYEKNSTQNAYIIYLNDGTAFKLGENSGDRLFLLYFYTRADKIQSKDFTKDRFAFVLNKNKCVVEPYINSWDGTREQLKSHSRYGCNKTSDLGLYCSKLIEYDGWQISKDYPW